MIDDVINFAVRLYLERSGSTPYDELSHVSGNESEEWLNHLMTLLAGGYYDVFREDEIIVSDILKSPRSFQKELQEYKARTVSLSSTAGLLASQWLSAGIRPWTQDGTFMKSQAFVEAELTKFN